MSSVIDSNFEKKITDSNFEKKLMESFYSFIQNEIKTIRNNYEEAKKNKNKRVAKDYVEKYPFLKGKSNYPSLDEILSWPSVKEKFGNKEDDKYEIIQQILISKITGIYKHGQTNKTELCNLRILSNIKRNMLTIAISKNTLDAKQQWESRLISSLKESYPGRDLKDLILIISSKFNDLDGNATHCKNVKEAFSEYAKSDFKIIFVCSNKQRINDILDFLERYKNLAVEKCLPIEVQQDEAHNKEEGVPSKRDLIEHIILNPYVETYVPVTASMGDLCVESSALWIKHNLEIYAIDYTTINQDISTSSDYSSISKAIPISFEKLKNHPSYKDYQITEFDEETFDEADMQGHYSDKKIWNTQEKIENDKKRRRQLEFCTFMAFEKDACNTGMNLLDNFHHFSYKEDDGTIIETPLILAGTKNFHIITTPNRVVLTLHLIKHALTKSYNPICIGLYRSEIHIHYKNRFGQVINKPFGMIEEKCSSEQMNDKIYKILEYLRSQGESIERPILIIGNYKPTGESITFVHYKYGTIRSVTLLPVISQTRETNYQGFLRCCYKDTKFREKIPGFKQPVKFIIGSQKSIDDALSYEKENDERVIRMLNDLNGGKSKNPLIKNNKSNSDDDDNISVPCKITVLDTDDENFQQFRKILVKRNRDEEDKRIILELIHKMIQNSSAEFSDTTNKFDFDTYILKDVRCWKRHEEADIIERQEKQGEKYKPFEADYRFREYDSKHTNKMLYINNKNNINENECEILVAYDKYEYEGFVNHKTCIWLSYRYVKDII